MPFADPVGAIAALHHPLSRRTYELVAERGWIGRDEAADALGVGRPAAAFHLDKLLVAGLLQARYERTSGRTGPGAGRTSKLYHRSPHEVDVSFPPRRYDLAGSLLADALTRAATGQTNVQDALAEAAHDTGTRIGHQAAEHRGRTTPRTALIQVLTNNGYQPHQHGRDIVLTNCPFHTLVDQHPDLVCQMNLDLLNGVVDGLGCTEKIRATLKPTESQCCVRLSPH